MSSSIFQAVRDLAEPKLAKFTAKLLPTVDPARILGVRTPALRKLAKKLLREHPQEVAEFKAAVPHDFQKKTCCMCCFSTRNVTLPPGMRKLLISCHI